MGNHNEFNTRYVLLICLLVLSFKSKSQDTLTLMTFNIYHGETMKGDFDLDTIAGVINRFNPDLVALQEVDAFTIRAKKMHLVNELALRTEMYGLFGPAMPYQEGFYGEGVLSRYPIQASRNHPLPYSPGHEPRSALEIIITLPSGRMLTFVGTHWDHPRSSRDRILQSQSCLNILLNSPFPTVLAGDLNDSPYSPSIKTLLPHMIATGYPQWEPTIPHTGPKRKIDYILLDRRFPWTILNSEVYCDPVATDHCIYISEVVLEP